MKKIAFTLAEVLITLGIIGIVAEMTIPTIINKAEKIATLSMLKKEYSMLSSLFNTAVAENGPITTWGLVGWGDTTGMVNIYKTILAPKLRISKYCGTDWTDTSCWAHPNYYIDGSDLMATIHGTMSLQCWLTAPQSRSQTFLTSLMDTLASRYQLM